MIISLGLEIAPQTVYNSTRQSIYESYLNCGIPLQDTMIMIQLFSTVFPWFPAMTQETSRDTKDWHIPQRDSSKAISHIGSGWCWYIYIYANIIWGYIYIYWWDPWHTINMAAPWIWCWVFCIELHSLDDRPPAVLAMKQEPVHESGQFGPIETGGYSNPLAMTDPWCWYANIKGVYWW